MLTHSPRAFPLGVKPPVGTCQSKGERRPKARGRRLRTRICLRKGCGRKYQARCWNQRFCQEPECQREVRRWQAARRQAKHRQDDNARARHAQAERERRFRAKSTPQAVQDAEVAPPRGHAAEAFFPAPLRSARLSRIPSNLSPQPRALLLRRLPSVGSQCFGSGAQVAVSRHLGRPQKTSLRVPGRSPPRFAAQSCPQQSATARAAGLTTRPRRAGRHLSLDRRAVS